MSDNYILIYEQAGYHVEGGGLYFQRFPTLEELDLKVNELLTKGQNGQKCEIKVAGLMEKEFKYSPVEIATVYIRD